MPFAVNLPQNCANKPRGLYSERAYDKREICVTKSARLILGGKFCVSKSIGLAYCDLSIVGKKFRSEFGTKLLLKLAVKT